MQREAAAYPRAQALCGRTAGRIVGSFRTDEAALWSASLRLSNDQQGAPDPPLTAAIAIETMMTTETFNLLLVARSVLPAPLIVSSPR
jgi:hypothetical protein